MKRRLFTILSALSLLLCVAMVVLWVRSYWVNDSLHYSHLGSSPPDDSYGVSIRVGLGGVTVSHHDGRLSEHDAFWYDSRRSVNWSDTPAEMIGTLIVSLILFQARVVPVPGLPLTLTLVTFPMWVPTTAMAILPVVWFRRWRRLRLAKRKGLCPKCGYDLRASKERCPECGTAIPADMASNAGSGHH